VTDSYSPVEASRVLGLSEKRVRQLADAGRLERVQERPLRVSMESVHALREERKTNPPGPGGGLPRPAADADALARLEAVAENLAATARRSIEASDSAFKTAESSLRDALDQSRARVTELEAKLTGKELELRSVDAARAAAEARVSDLEAELAESRARRGWFRRNPPQATP
jgi:chromosome segregation ATPase